MVRLFIENPEAVNFVVENFSVSAVRRAEREIFNHYGECCASCSGWIVEVEDVNSAREMRRAGIACNFVESNYSVAYSWQEV